MVGYHEIPRTVSMDYFQEMIAQVDMIHVVCRDEPLFATLQNTLQVLVAANLKKLSHAQFKDVPKSVLCEQLFLLDEEGWIDVASSERATCFPIPLVLDVLKRTGEITWNGHFIETVRLTERVFTALANDDNDRDLHGLFSLIHRHNGLSSKRLTSTTTDVVLVNEDFTRDTSIYFHFIQDYLAGKFRLFQLSSFLSGRITSADVGSLSTSNAKQSLFQNIQFFCTDDKLNSFIREMGGSIVDQVVPVCIVIYCQNMSVNHYNIALESGNVVADADWLYIVYESGKLSTLRYRQPPEITQTFADCVVKIDEAMRTTPKMCAQLEKKITLDGGQLVAMSDNRLANRRYVSTIMDQIQYTDRTYFCAKEKVTGEHKHPCIFTHFPILSPKLVGETLGKVYVCSEDTAIAVWLSNILVSIRAATSVELVKKNMEHTDFQNVVSVIWDGICRKADFMNQVFFGNPGSTVYLLKSLVDSIRALEEFSFHDCTLREWSRLLFEDNDAIHPTSCDAVSHCVRANSEPRDIPISSEFTSSTRSEKVKCRTPPPEPTVSDKSGRVTRDSHADDELVNSSDSESEQDVRMSAIDDVSHVKDDACEPTSSRAFLDQFPTGSAVVDIPRITNANVIICRLKSVIRTALNRHLQLEHINGYDYRLLCGSHLPVAFFTTEDGEMFSDCIFAASLRPATISEPGVGEPLKKIILQEAASMLEDHGLHVTQVWNGTDVLEMYCRDMHGYDILILDARSYTYQAGATATQIRMFNTIANLIAKLEYQPSVIFRPLILSVGHHDESLFREEFAGKVLFMDSLAVADSWTPLITITCEDATRQPVFSYTASSLSSTSARNAKTSLQQILCSHAENVASQQQIVSKYCQLHTPGFLEGHRQYMRLDICNDVCMEADCMQVAVNAELRVPKE